MHFKTCNYISYTGERGGAPPDNTNLLHIAKIHVFQCRIDDVSWNGDKIYVLKEVTIYPPYRPEDVKGNMDSKALKHVRKIVSRVCRKFYLILHFGLCRCELDPKVLHCFYTVNILYYLRWKNTSTINLWPHRHFQAKVQVPHHLFPRPLTQRKRLEDQFQQVVHQHRMPQQLEQHHLRQRSNLRLTVYPAQIIAGIIKNRLARLQLAHCPINRPIKITLGREANAETLPPTHPQHTQPQAVVHRTAVRRVVAEVVHQVLET